MPETMRVWVDQLSCSNAPHTLSDAIETLVYAFLEQSHSGWEDNDGAYGDFTFDVGNRTITLDYNERYTESDYSCHTF